MTIPVGPRAKVDRGLAIGMSVCFLRSDLETVAENARTLGFEGLEVHIDHLGPGMVGVPVFERHSEMAGELIRRQGLVVSTLNAVGDEQFAPFEGTDAVTRAAKSLAGHLRLAAAMGSPRVLIYEGRVSDQTEVGVACDKLRTTIEAARELAGLLDPPDISIECHPFTFALAQHGLGQLAAALADVGAGICLDFCHFGVAMGPDFMTQMDDQVLATINHVHFSDTDLKTSELHFPPGLGALDLPEIARRLAGMPVAIAWDLFGWPSPRHAIGTRMGAYRAFLNGQSGSL